MCVYVFVQPSVCMCWFALCFRDSYTFTFRFSLPYPLNETEMKLVEKKFILKDFGGLKDGASC